MKKLTILAVILLGATSCFSPVYAHQQVVVVPLGKSNNNSIIGSWWNGETPQNDDVFVLTFLDDTHYFFGQYGNSDPNGQDGMEHGTYTWDASSGDFTTVTIERDDNSQWGLSHPVGNVTVTIEGNTFTYTDDIGSDQLTRVGY